MVNPKAIANALGIQATGDFDRTFHNDKKDSPLSAENNALKNASGAAAATKETATLVLRGYPLLKAKTTLEITGVGAGAGIWYCKTVIQQWHVEHGYLTNAQLIKGEGGGDGGQSDPSDTITPSSPRVN
jgi:hypothetical protein